MLYFQYSSIILTGLWTSIGFTHSYSSRLILCTLERLVQYKVYKVIGNVTVMTFVTVWRHYMMCVSTIVLECHQTHCVYFVNLVNFMSISVSALVNF